MSKLFAPLTPNNEMLPVGVFDSTAAGPGLVPPHSHFQIG